MKTQSFLTCLLASAASGAMLASLPALAQNVPPAGTNGTVGTPIVTIRALDVNASEAGARGRFQVARGERTNGQLSVWLQIGGTAIPGADYQAISNVVVIADGTRATDIVVTPVDDAMPEPAESVVVRVILSPLASPVISYVIGATSSASLSIADNDGFVESNKPPVVALVQPQNGAVFPMGAWIVLSAEAHDQDGSVASVEFFADNQSLGLGLRGGTPGTVISNRWSLSWSNAASGEHTVTAKATDNRGAMAASASVRIRVGTNTPPPPPTNEPVRVNIIATDPHASEGLVMWCSNTVVGVNEMGANPLWRTNCPNVTGTNTATFTVRRSGPTNSSLRVYYGIGGSASNGVDYVRLADVVTIPAGYRSAQIIVVPLDDNLPERIETVALRLRLPPLPLDAADSPYTIDRPDSAAAFIADNDAPPPPCAALPDGMFHACERITNQCFRVEISTNLVHWDIVCTNSIADGAARHIDPDAANHVRRFFRFLPVPCPVEQP